MPFKVEVVPSPKSILGEGPHWDEGHQNLFYNDIYGEGESILRYDFRENKDYSARIDGEPVVGFIIPVANTTDEYAVGLGRRVGIVHWDGVSPKAILGPIVFEVEDESNNTRFNDSKADPVGRFYGGTMRLEALGDLFEHPAGTFYKYIKFYYIDSCKLDIKEFDYDPSSGDISKERVAIDFKGDGGTSSLIPDGMTIDTEGNLYVATFRGSKVLKVDPRKGKILMEIPIPAKQVTSVAFGGPNLDILYVTTARIAISASSSGINPTDKPSELAGCLFKVTGLGAKGFPGVKVRV